jgi:CheY-like chemotaxis protein
MSPKPKQYRALVVDDNHDIAHSFAEMLRLIDCQASFVTDPRRAVEEALRLRPHIVFLDIGMPHLDGYEVAKELRNHFPPEEMKLVAVTAYGGPEDRRASRKVGFDAHVKKPIDPAFVESIINTVMDRPPTPPGTWLV